MLAALAIQHGFEFKRLSIRLQRTRWGSCSTRGTISINLALLFQRPEVLRYLMCHELAHTRHMNHSATYWRTRRRLRTCVAVTRSRALAGMESRTAVVLSFAW